METEFKIGDKIRITKNSYATNNFFYIGREFIITAITDYIRRVIVVDDQLTIDPDAPKDNFCYGDWELVEEKSRFYDAQPGDLLWNDDLGVCEIIRYGAYTIGTKNIWIKKVDSEAFSDIITLDGKRYLDSPKATFFYYTPENHYLTERPEPEVDWSKTEKGVIVRVSNCNKIFTERPFYGYDETLNNPFIVYSENMKDIYSTYKYCKLA